VFAEHCRDPISVSVADQQPSRIQVSFVPTAGLDSRSRVPRGVSSEPDPARRVYVAA
jgi:hypothetical protein